MSEEIGLTLADFAKVTGVSRETLKQHMRNGDLRLPSWQWANKSVRPRWNRYLYADALTIEVARQLSAAGVSFRQAIEIVFMSGGIDTIGDWPRNDDLWAWAIGGPHAKGGGGSEDHGCGSLADAVKAAGRNDGRYFTGSPARILLSNVSAADTRLRERVEAIGGVKIKDNEFIAEAE